MLTVVLILLGWFSLAIALWLTIDIMIMLGEWRNKRREQKRKPEPFHYPPSTRNGDGQSPDDARYWGRKQ